MPASIFHGDSSPGQMVALEAPGAHGQGRPFGRLLPAQRLLLQENFLQQFGADGFAVFLPFFR